LIAFDPKPAQIVVSCWSPRWNRPRTLHLSCLGQPLKVSSLKLYQFILNYITSSKYFTSTNFNEVFRILLWVCVWIIFSIVCYYLIKLKLLIELCELIN